MLITNFSAGELSEELFGRTDLGQYFQGAARVDNFDLIPTGGIQRRSGTQRFALSDGDGRIIPFLLDRGRSLLLCLTSGKIAVYSQEGGIIFRAPQIITGNEDMPLYETVTEINEVQYAQNFNTMILCHENKPPFRLDVDEEKFLLNEGFLRYAGFFHFDTEVEVNAKEDINKSDYFEVDEEYKNNGWLSRMGEWPRAVTFYNDRIIFAGTKNNPQRLFVSGVVQTGKEVNFATYKKFITEQREYITIEAKINIGANTITMLKPGEIGKFHKNLSEYYVQSPYFIEGTKVVGLQGHTLLLTHNTKDLALSEDELGAFLTWKDKIEYGDKWSDTYTDFYLVESGVGRPIEPDRSFLILRFRNGKFQHGGYNVWGTNWGDEINLQDAEKCVTNWQFLYDYVFERIGKPNFEVSGSQNFTAFINDFWSYIKERMQYPLVIEGISRTLYGTPAQIYEQIMGDAPIKDGEDELIVLLYTKEFTIEKYPTPDCGFTFEIASDMNDAIRWLVTNKGLIVGTETGEWIIPPGVTATSIQATLNSRYGSDKIQGMALRDATIFFQSGKKSLVEYYIPQQDNNFRANNMAMMALQMLNESQAIDFDYTSSPYTKLLVVRADGNLATLLYDRSFGVFAWSRYSLAGKVKSVAVVPGKSGYDDVYLLVEYDGKFYLELLEYGREVYLDSHKKTGPLTWAEDITEYDAERAVVVSVTKDAEGRDVYETLPITAAPGWKQGGECYIGYPYRSVLRTLPVLANNKMAKQRITSLTFRFLKSFLPKVSSIAGGRNIKTDTITNLKTPFSGVHKIAFPGTWDEEVQVELIHEAPEPVKILSLNAEVQ